MLRVTQTYLSALASATGTVRVTQAYISVLCKTGYDCPAESELTVSVDAVAEISGIHNTSAESPLDLISSGNIVMALRVTQTYVSVLGADTGTLRATQTYISVLAEHSTGGTEYDVSAASALDVSDESRTSLIVVSASSISSLTSASSAPSTHHETASSSLSLTSSAVGLPPHDKSATDSLAITDSARSGITFVSALDTLTLSDVGRKTDTYTLSSSSSFSITQAASHLPTGRVQSENTLAFSQDADTNIKVRSLSVALVISDSASGDRVKQAVSTLSLLDGAVQGILSLFASSEIALASSGSNSYIRLFSEEQLLTLSSSARSSILMLNIEDTLSVSDTASNIGPRYASGVSEMTSVEQVYDLDTDSLVDVITGLSQEASSHVVGPRQASSIISFAQSAGRSHVKAVGINLTAENALDVDDLAINSIVGQAANTVTLSNVASATVGVPISNTLSTLGVAASVVVIRGVAANNAILVSHAVAFVLEKDDTLCTYSPFVGSNSDPNAPTPPSTTYKAAQGTPGFRLQYPGTGTVTDELILRAPNLGNIDRLSMTRINTETRGGTLIVFADPIWPKVETLLLSFSGLSADESQNLLTFMEDHLGEEIRLIDWEDRLWKGVIVNPQDPVVQDGRDCQFTASFEFEGEKV